MDKSSDSIILVDGSYFIFYRFHALKMWWNKANKDKELGNPIENKEFVEKFKTVFKTKLLEISKKLKCKGANIIVARDCSRENIWRNAIHHTAIDITEENIDIERLNHLTVNNYENLITMPKDTWNLQPTKLKYKAGRTLDQGVGPFFKMVYSEDLFNKALDKTSCVMMHPNLEADDCIALYIKYYSTYLNHIYIIANDHDYLQLTSEKVKLFNLKYKEIICDDPKKSLFIKCVIGDKSDNIKGIFKRCGVKTAEKYYLDRELFDSQSNKEIQIGGMKIKYSLLLFKLNQLLIDFNNIPEILEQDFINNFSYCCK